MKPIAHMMYEILPEEIEQLPSGFQIFRHNREHDSWSVLRKDNTDSFLASKEYTYYLMKIPPATFHGHAGK